MVLSTGINAAAVAVVCGDCFFELCSCYDIAGVPFFVLLLLWLFYFLLLPLPLPAWIVMLLVVVGAVAVIPVAAAML